VAGKGALAALLTGKGKLISPLAIYHRGDHFLVEFPGALRESLPKKLGMYTLGSKAEVEDITDLLALLSVHGPKAAETLAAAGATGLPEALMSSAAVGVGGLEVTAVRVDDLGEVGFDLHFPVAAADDVRQALVAAGAAPIGPVAAEVLRIEVGMPRFGAELTGELLPPEIPMLVDRAISYSKGCFVGQETIARIRTYGHVNRELRGLIVEGDALPVPGAALTVEGKKAGEVTSACVQPLTGRRLALGFVKRGLNDPGATVTVETPDGPAEAKVVMPGELRG
jgi:folate-binding protein YgfZ